MHYRFWGLLDSCLAANEKLGLSEEILERAFDLWWPELERRLKEISLTTPGIKRESPKGQLHEEKLDEILEITRRIEKGQNDSSQPEHNYYTRQCQKGHKNDRPSLFIGSSSEGLAVAEVIQLGLDEVAECTLWTQGAFNLSQTTIESIIDATVKFDFAVLILTPDDMTIKRGKLRASARDNILFELGLFTGALGRARTFMVFPRDSKPEFPSDLEGVTAATYADRADGNLEAALGPVCTRIKKAMGVA